MKELIRIECVDDGLDVYTIEGTLVDSSELLFQTTVKCHLEFRPVEVVVPAGVEDHWGYVQAYMLKNRPQEYFPVWVIDLMTDPDSHVPLEDMWMVSEKYNDYKDVCVRGVKELLGEPVDEWQDIVGKEVIVERVVD